MTILSVLPYSSRIGEPFCDFLNVTTPSDYGAEATRRVLPIVESLGFIEGCGEGVYRLLGKDSKPCGSFKVKNRGKVAVFSASGGVLSCLRSVGLLDAFLTEFAVLPHRVSMLHATLDYLDIDPPGRIRAVDAAGHAGDLALSRKRLLPKHVSSLLSANSAGDKTGTVYLGNRANADVWAKVYDKQHERLSRGFADPGPLVRVEVAVQSDMGATLKDASDPAALFFHFAGRSLVQQPPGFAGWVAGGEGYVLAPRVEVLPLQRLDRLLDFSPDVSRVVDIAIEAYGEKAGDVLARLFREKAEARLARRDADAALGGSVS